MGAEQFLEWAICFIWLMEVKLHAFTVLLSDAEVEEVVSHLKRQGLPSVEEILNKKNIENNDSFMTHPLQVVIAMRKTFLKTQ